MRERVGEGGKAACPLPNTHTHTHPTHTHARSIVYDIGTARESFEWFRVRGAAPTECVVGRERVDVRSLPPPAPGAARAAPRAAVAGGGSAPSGVGGRARARGVGASRAGSGVVPSAAAAAAAAAFASAPVSGFDDDGFLGGGAPAYAGDYRGAY